VGIMDPKATMMKLTPRPPNYPPPWSVLAVAGWTFTQMWTLYSSWNRNNHQEPEPEPEPEPERPPSVARDNYKEDRSPQVSAPCATRVGETVTHPVRFAALNT
jgi:hypothetical protein